MFPFLKRNPDFLADWQLLVACLKAAGGGLEGKQAVGRGLGAVGVDSTALCATGVGTPCAHLLLSIFLLNFAS